MQKINEVADRAAKTLETSTPTINRGPTQKHLPMLSDGDRDFVNRLFRRLTACAPGWRQSVVGEPPEWEKSYKAELFASLVDHGAATREAVGHGVRRWKRMGKPWLPAPGEFAELCRPREHPSHKHFQALVEKPADPETAKGWIDKIKADRGAKLETEEAA